MGKLDNGQTVYIQKETNGAAVTALVLGIIGCVIGFLPYSGWFMAPVWALAVLFGLIGLRKKYRRGMSVLGLLFGVGGAAYKIGFWIVAAGGFMSFLSGAADLDSTSSTSVSEEVSAAEDTEDSTEPSAEESSEQADTSIVKRKDAASNDSKESGETSEEDSTDTASKQTENDAEVLELTSFDFSRTKDVIAGRSNQLFLFVYVTAEFEAEEPFLSEINRQLFRFRNADIEVIGVTNASAKYADKQAIQYSKRIFKIPRLFR
ncbi:hypothetical protein NQ129_04845 [Priestia aryabhattai]|uniref:hypothetical protein n=1 Tax=Priestia aryabhattai TaxID=412384 RepID=UPI00211CFBC8|nr:hypothetical protein [Priestia aryabhattai]MCQ9281096.1 hypothetical protein [Priestia aryabhattai]